MKDLRVEVNVRIYNEHQGGSGCGFNENVIISGDFSKVSEIFQKFHDLLALISTRS